MIKKPLYKVNKYRFQLKYIKFKKLFIVNFFHNLKIKKIIYFILFILSYFFYYLSLEKCLKGFDICGSKTKWIFIKLREAIISYAILAILFEGMICKIISKFHIFHIIVMYFIFYNYSHGLDFHDHGFFNFIGCVTIVPLILFALMPLNGLFIIYKKNKKFIYVYLGVLIIFFIVCYYFVDSYMNCKDWPKGLNNTYIDNDISRHGCFLKIPKTCPYKIGKYFFDFTKLKKIKCKNNKENTKKVLIKFSSNSYINKKTIHIGFPLVNSFYFNVIRI